MASKEEVKGIALLARLSVEDERMESLTGEFNAIVDYIAALDGVATDDVEPMSHVHGSVNVFREDAVIHTITSEQGMQNAPDREGNSFKVPLVIGQD